MLDVIGGIGGAAKLGDLYRWQSPDGVVERRYVGAFQWAKSQPQYANLNLASIILVTLPQPIRVQMIRSGGVALGNLDVRREPTLVL